MIHPSYVELMRVVNDDVVIGEEPVVNSRYSIVCATAKRARQLIDGAYPLKHDASVYKKKPLSVAVDELYEGDLRILTKEEADDQYHEFLEAKEKNREAFEKRRAIEAEMEVDVDEDGKSSDKKSAKTAKKAAEAMEEDETFDVDDANDEEFDEADADETFEEADDVADVDEE